MRAVHSLVGAMLVFHLSGTAAVAAACLGNLTPDEIVTCLSQTKPKTRGFSIGTRGVAVQGEEAAGEGASVNLTVNFEFNSAALGTDGMISLDALGKALSDPALRGGRFRIAGHTDAVGSDSYNQRLSEARAAAVRSYLVGRYQLNETSFEIVGYGKSRPYDASDPMAAVNRRVQVTRLDAP